MITVVDLCKIFLLAKPYIDSIWFVTIGGINLLQTSTALVGILCSACAILYLKTTRIYLAATTILLAKLLVMAIGLSLAMSYPQAIGGAIKEVIAPGFLLMGLRVTRNRDTACIEFLDRYKYIILFVVINLALEKPLQNIFNIGSQNIYTGSDGEEYYRATGTYPDQGTVVQYLVIAIPHLLVHIKKSLINVILLILGVILTFELSERTFIVSLIVAALFFSIRYISIVKIVIFTIAMGSLSLLADKFKYLFLQFETLWSTLQSGLVSIEQITGFASGRVGIWYDMYKIMADSPSLQHLLFGYGIDNTRYYVGLARGLSPSEIYIPESASLALAAHNDIFRIIFESGILGISVTVAMFWLLWKMICHGKNLKITLVLKAIFIIAIVRSFAGHEQYHISSFYPFLFLIGANFRIREFERPAPRLSQDETGSSDLLKIAGKPELQRLEQS
jgi:hypothetical protein